MGLDVDIYRIKKGNYSKTQISRIIDEKDYFETIYMRKPDFIWDKLEKKYGDLNNTFQLSKEQMIEIKDMLKPIIENFNSLLEEQDKKISFDIYVYNLRKYVDFYDIINFALQRDDSLVIDWIY